jgi:flagellar basal body-associated protein FliL
MSNERGSVGSLKKSAKSSKTVWLIALIVVLSFILPSRNLAFGQEEAGKGAGGGARTIKMRVVAANPSSDKVQTVPIKIYLPEEATPKDIINSGDLAIEFDDEKSMYYAFKKEVALKPKEVRVFDVEIKDVWLVPQSELDSLKEQTEFVLKRFENNEYREAAQKLADAIYSALGVVARTQYDETLSSKSHIGVYRDNLKVVAQVKEDIEKLEKRLTLSSAMPVPEVLEKAKVKTKAPTMSTTWMIIFIIIIFMGMLAGVFFFTWHTQSSMTKDTLGGIRKSSFPKSGGDSKEQSSKEKG